MPSVQAQCYSISFHPIMSEWIQYKDLFLKQFEMKCKTYKVILVKEKGSKDVFTHYQGFIDCQKEVRADTLRISFHKMVLKDMEIGFPKVALKITPVTRDVKYCQGYTLKETNDEMTSVVKSDYSDDELVSFKDYHAGEVYKKNVHKDKFRVNLRNLSEIFKRYCECNDLIVEEYDNERVASIIGKMGKEDYYVMPIVLAKNFDHIVQYLKHYMNDTLELFCVRRYKNC